MSDPFEISKAVPGLRPIKIGSAAMGRGSRQAATQIKNKQFKGAATTMGQSTKKAGQMGAVGAKQAGRSLKSQWDKAGFGTKLAVTAAGVGTATGVGAYAGRKTFGKSEDPFEVEKSIAPGVRVVATGAKPKRVQAAQDVMAMKGSGRKTLKAMDKLRPKK